ncbi:hypothetical protein BUALT_Bualt05G0016100 [Buddleja alternifolia]|uniref:Exostosin GT47 domain-containing protein n=1 Tax=Buddleja alternifolia TaxID=168488 RepID=A0AAV6XS64_9LAMI|nr:hypothetical protein BUALT_Bualt05G0016100 [Buddleja alternifolia]
MGYDFHRKCNVETRKVLWLIGLVLVSVVMIQYFELPYRDNFLSLLSYGKSYLRFSDANGDREFLGSQSDFKNSSSPKPVDRNIPGEDLMPENASKMNHTAEEETIERSISIAPEMASDIQFRVSAENGVDISPSPMSLAYPPVNVARDISPSVGSREETSLMFSGEISRIAPSPTSLDVLLAPMVSPSQSISHVDIGIALGVPMVASSPPNTINKNETSRDSRNSNTMKNDRAPSNEHSSVTNSLPPPTKEMPQSPVKSFVSISEMNDMLLRSRISSFSKIPLWPSPADQELMDARFRIENADIIRGHPGLYAPVYRNLSSFVRSYEMMEQRLKVYIYRNGKKPVFHQPRLKGIYASEGWFMKLMKASNRYVTSNPNEAHLFYLPFSSQLLVDYVYVKDSHTFRDINEYLKNYLDMIKTRYSFWNRTDGSDHFVVACHDWAPIETRRIMANCIRALCNSDVKEGFQFGKDVSLPETSVHSPNPSKEIGGSPPSGRKTLAFFAGKMHGYVRPILLKYWENKDPEMKIVGRMGKSSYIWHMKNSKYCICAKGYEVNSPRVVEALIYGCVPVIVSDNFVPPFFEILKWDSFSVFVPEKDIPNLKDILLSIPEKRYLVMQHRVKQVRQHFLWHSTPVKYDIFHMILHSIWYSRVFRLSPR